MACVAWFASSGFNPNCEFRLRNEAGVFEVFARNNIAAGAALAPVQPRHSVHDSRSGFCVAGDEACISYGEKLSNAELRDRYGFDIPGNPNGEEKAKFRDPYAGLS